MADGGRGAASVEVRVSPGELPKVFWKDPSGNIWRVPHDWRRRRIRLPDCGGLLRNGLPLDIPHPSDLVSRLLGLERSRAIVRFQMSGVVRLDRDKAGL